MVLLKRATWVEQCLPQMRRCPNTILPQEQGGYWIFLRHCLTQVCIRQLALVNIP